jgi:hypothetical protein
VSVLFFTAKEIGVSSLFHSKGNRCQFSFSQKEIGVSSLFHRKSVSVLFFRKSVSGKSVEEKSVSVLLSIREREIGVREIGVSSLLDPET